MAISAGWVHLSCTDSRPMHLASAINLLFYSGLVCVQRPTRNRKLAGQSAHSLPHSQGTDRRDSLETHSLPAGAIPTEKTANQEEPVGNRAGIPRPWALSPTARRTGHLWGKGVKIINYHSKRLMLVNQLKAQKADE